MPCNSCIETNLKFYKNLKNYFYQSNFRMAINNKKINDLQPSKKWLARENKNAKTLQTIEKKLQSAGEMWIKYLDQINKSELPKVAIIFNGYSFPESVIKHYLDEHGVKTYTFEMGFKEDSIFISNDFAPDYFFEFNEKFLTHSESEN